MSISQEEKQKSIKFIEALDNIIGVLDELKEHIPDGAYLTICNNLKIHYDLKEYIADVLTTIAKDKVVKEHMARSTRKVRDNRQLTDAEKLQKGWVICNKCDRLVLDLTGHQERDICNKIKTTKRLSATTGKEETSEYHRTIALIQYHRSKRNGLI